MVKVSVLILTYLLVVAGWASAQESRIDLEVGAGYAATRNAGPPPDLPVLNAGIGLWFNDHVGVAGSVSFGPGEQQNPPESRLEFPIGAGDRLFLAAKSLRLGRVTFRYRRQIDALGSMTMKLGGGIQFHGRYDHVTLFAQSATVVVPRDFRDSFSGLSTEAFLGRNITPWFSLNGGLIIDFSLDRAYYQPAIHVTFRVR